MVTNLDIFIFSWNFAIRQIRGCWFQIWQYYFQIQAQKYPNNALFVPYLRIFIFVPNFAARQIWGGWSQNMTMIFQNCCQKHPIKAFLVPNLRVFISASNFTIIQVRGRRFQIWEQRFRIPARNYLRILIQKCKSFFQIPARKYVNTKISLTTHK